MKQAIVIFLSFLILSTAVNNVSTFAFFKLNQTFIANTLCINKDKPEMDCQGHCFLKMSLKKNHDEKSKKPVTEKEEKTINLLQPVADVYLLNHKPFYELIFSQKTLSSQPFLSGVFHPPQDI